MKLNCAMHIFINANHIPHAITMGSTILRKSIHKYNKLNKNKFMHLLFGCVVCKFSNGYLLTQIFAFAQ